jgi:hypothetical protein
MVAGGAGQLAARVIFCPCDCFHLTYRTTRFESVPGSGVRGDLAASETE